MSRTPAYLAAVASSAVPGLDPVAVRAARATPGSRCDLAFITDSQRRAWVVRVPSTAAVGAQLDTVADLLPLLSRRLPYGVPSPRGFAPVPEGRAVVYPYLHGRSIVLAEVLPGPGIAAQVGKAVAALHNVDRAVFDEAGVPVYDAETCRTRHLADLDRAAATGHFPSALLTRWEHALEDVSMWRFAPTPTHGDLHGGRLLVSFADENDSDTVSVRAVTGWEHAKVGDPADDFAVLAAECTPAAFESIVEAYALARVERPDRHLRLRARLLSELLLMTQLLDAVTAGEPELVARRAAELRTLAQRTADEPGLATGEPGAEQRPGMPAAPPAEAAAEASGGGEHTQLLKVGAAAEATTVIPDDELDRLRAASPAPPDAAGQAGLGPGPEPETPTQPMPQRPPESEVIETNLEVIETNLEDDHARTEPAASPEAPDRPDRPGRPDRLA